MNINYVDKTISSKIVYYGPALSGKTTNLDSLCKMEPNKTGKLITLNTENERTVFFDYLKVLETVGGFKLKTSFYTVPGQPVHHATRKLVLSGVDAVVFIADSDPAKIEANQTALVELNEFLKGQDLNLETLPYVLQLNKRDLTNAEDMESLSQKLRFKNERIIEAVATDWKGVLETKDAIISELIAKAQELFKPRVSDHTVTGQVSG